jgi:hypothetical protein
MPLCNGTEWARVPCGVASLLQGDLYQYRFNYISCTWHHWMDPASRLEFPTTARFQDLIVPTLDSIRAAALLQMHVTTAKKHLLFVGPSGAGCAPTTADAVHKPSSCACCRNQLPCVLLINIVGTGKTMYVRAGLNQLSPGAFSIISTTLSAHSSANQVRILCTEHVTWP